MHEDWAIEARVLPPASRVLCIASAGCTALALAARGHETHAVDVNPAQVAYVRSRMLGEPVRDGAAERLLAAGRRLARLAGLSTAVIARFLAMDDPVEQEAAWRERVAGRRLRFAASAALSRPALCAVYARDLVRSLPAGFGRVVLERVRRGVGRHPNRSNPYLHRLLAGAACEDPLDPSPPQLWLEVTDVLRHLRRCPPAAFDGFALSNVLDGADPRYGHAVAAEVRRTARPGAVVVLRTFAEPSGPAAARWAAEDRSMLWGGVVVESAATGSFGAP
jgi:Protein of unknown function (DUF3419)